MNKIILPNQPQKLAVIDFLRGYSIFTIVLMHLLLNYNLPSWLSKASMFGGAGVHVFIFVSGFGLYLSYLNNPLSYKDFLRKRFGRIYWPMAIICLITAFWMYYQGQSVLMPLLGNLLLFKMFVPSLEDSMGTQMWFISTIIQFYLTWPLIVKLINIKWGGWIALAISLIWSTFVGLSGLGVERIWNSFFLQYLWEFCLGMKIAELYNCKRFSSLETPKWKYLIPACVLGVVMTGVMGVAGLPWKLYNDIPSLIGYVSMALIIYKIRVLPINRFFSYTNRFSYEWYLVHILVFQIVQQYTADMLSDWLEILLCLSISYTSAWAYSLLWRHKKKPIINHLLIN